MSKTWGGRVCCKTPSNECGWPQTATASPRCSTPASMSPCASNSSPSCTSCKKNRCTASWSVKSKSNIVLSLREKTWHLIQKSSNPHLYMWQFLIGINDNLKIIKPCIANNLDLINSFVNFKYPWFIFTREDV